MQRRSAFLLLLALFAVSVGVSAQAAAPAGARAARPLGKPVLEAPTLHSLGVYWIIQGDDNKNATIAFSYRKAGEAAWKQFLKWNNVRYATMAEVREKAPVYKHAVLIDAATVFASGIKPPDEWASLHAPAAMDLRLRQGTAAIDAGQRLPGFNNGFAGKAPDLGAYEFGSPLPHYGPRPEPGKAARR